MKKMLRKEICLAASPLSFFFILFGLLTFCPGYPILLGGFFVCLGIFQSFQAAREANDMLYSALLPIPKADTVKSKYVFCVFVQLCAFVLCTAATLLRMTALSEALLYRNNALMGANLVYLGELAVLFGLFNVLFVGGFFRTAYGLARPFIGFIAAAFLWVGLAETLWHFPGLSVLNAFGFDHMVLQGLCLAAGLALYGLMTLAAMRRARRSFEKLDL